MKVVVFCFCLLFSLSHAAVYADLFGLLMNGTDIGSVVAIDMEAGFKVVVDLGQIAPNFTNYNNLTFYDANSETYIVGNADPPMLALVNTFNGQTKIVRLPLYGQLLAMTAYDGIVYSLLGLDEDVPVLGSIVAYDISDGDSERLAKFKITADQTYVSGSTLTWLPHMQAWIFELKDSSQNQTMFLVNKSPTTSVVIPLNMPGGYESVWYDVTTDNKSIIAYSIGVVYSINLNDYTYSRIFSYDCPGILTVNFQKQQLLHFSNCDSPIIETYSWYNNRTLPIVDLDPQLEDLVSIQSVGTYIPYLCGAPCGTHPDCANSKTCNTCRDGTCSALGDCNAFCISNKDCYAGVCVGNCENNRCGKRGCAAKCNNHDDCVSQSQECQVCRLGQCVAQGDCGSYCLTNLDCYAGACNLNCKNFRCSPN